MALRLGVDTPALPPSLRLVDVDHHAEQQLPKVDTIQALGNLVSLPERTGSLPLPEPVTLGPGSMLWETFDARTCYTGLAAGLLQMMHPDIGAGVAEHSIFPRQPWQRIYVTLPVIIGAIFDENAEATGRHIRDQHKSIKGINEQGQRYHALNPKTWWWAHATFHHMVEEVLDRFDERVLTLEDRERLYAETTEWYRRYGVSSKPVPPTYADFRRKWNHICKNELEMTKEADRAIDMVVSHDAARIPGVPQWLWPLGRWSVSEFARLTAIGGLPVTVREKHGIPWSASDEQRLKVIEASVRTSWRLPLPELLKYHPRARQGRKREHQHQKQSDKIIRIAARI